MYTKVVLNHCPKESDRESRACKLYENTQLMADALLKRDIVDTSSLHLLKKEFHVILKTCCACTANAQNAAKT